MTILELGGTTFRAVRSSLAALTALLLCVGIAGRALAAPLPAASQQNLSAPFADGELILTFEQGVDEAQIRAFYVQFSPDPSQQVSEIENLAPSPRYAGPAMRRVRVPEGMERDLIARMVQDARVRYAELNFLITLDATPNDTDYALLWGMHNTGQTGGTNDADIDAPEAWDRSTGASTVLVMGIDTGVDTDHPDLVANLWVNPGEIAGNLIDDDGNGYVDDVYGINTILNNGNPEDDHFHGTHTLGTVGARGNNSLGVVGVNWNVKMAACKFLNSGGSGTTADAIQCFQYLNDMKQNFGQDFDVTNNSWGGGGFDQALQDVMEGITHPGMPPILHSVSAGNSNADCDTAFGCYPAEQPSANIISVAATDHNDIYAGFSNYGVTTVDLAAPGVNTFSTSLAGGYAYASGTSMAAPHVAGCAALMLAAKPAWTTAQIKAAILNSADPLPLQAKQTLTNDRLNCNNAMILAGASSTSLVINEIDYDQPSTDTAEFIEIKNVSGAAINLSGWKLELVNGNAGGAALYQTINLPAVSLAAGDYYVVCANAANTPNCDLDVTPDTNLVQNGAPDAVGLRNAAGTLIDAVSYDGNSGAPYTETSGVGLTDSSSINYIGISRFADGVDTGVNNVDLSRRCISPGEANLAAASNCLAPGDATVDLQILKTDSPDPVIAGTNLSYQVTVNNLGPGVAGGFTISDSLPSTARFVSALPTGPGASCTTPAVGVRGGTVTCSFGPMPTTLTASIAIVVGTCPEITCGQTISNSATVTLSPPQIDPNLANNTATAVTTVQTQSNLSITKTGNPNDVVVGQDVVYTLVVTNNGPSNAAGVVVTDNLPPNFVFVGAQVSNGGTCSAVGTVVTCNLGVVGAPNQCTTSFPQSVTIQISATAGDNPGLAAPGCPSGLVTNRASVRSANCLADTGTLAASAETCVHPPPPTESAIEFDLVPSPEGPDPCLVGLVETQILVSEAGDGEVFNFPDTPETVITWNSGLEVVSCTVILPAGGSCNFSGRVVNFDYGLPVGGTFEARVVLRFVGGLGNNSLVSGEICLNWDGLIDRLPDRIFIQADDQRCTALIAQRIFCPPLVDPNRQLGGQVHLPILNFQGQDDVCRSWIEVQYIGCDASKAVLVTWGEPGFCPPQAAGPLKVECTGLLQPGSTWNLLGAQIPTGSKSGILFKFTAKQLGELPGNPGPTLADDFGFDDVAADLMCETLFFGVVGDSDDYRRFKKAYNESLSFASIPQGIVAGEGVLAVEVLRHCPGDVTPGVEVSSKYNGIAGAHLGFYDPLFGGFGYYVPLIYAEKAGLNTVMYIQNGGLECSSVEIWFKAQDDCLRARICEIFTLAPGETYQWDASDCVGPDWQGSAWLRSSQELGIAVDIFGRDILMTYNAEPAPYDYVVGFDEETGDPIFERTPTTGERVAYGPLVYSEFQGWDTGIQVQNLSQILNAKVKVYFLDRSGDVITTLVDWICPRGSQTFFLPVVAGLPGNWVGSVRIESQDWWAPGTNPVDAPYVVGVATLMKYSDVARTATEEAIAYNLLPEHKSYVWQVGYGPGGRYSGVALIAIPSLLKDLDGTGTTSELAIMNLVAKPGFTDFAIYIYDQNGLVDFVCQKLHDRQVEYIDMQAWGYVNNGFKGSAIISATFWEHEVFDGGGHFIRNLVGLGAVSVERTGTRLGEDVPGDEAAGSRGIPLAQDSRLAVCRGGYLPACPGQPAASPVDGDCGPIQATGAGGAIPDSGGGIFVSSVSPSFVGDCAVRDVNLSLDISHTFVGDLNVSLLHGGTSSSLFNAVCGADDNIDVTLDDDNPEGRGNIGNAASCAGVGPVGGGNTYASQSGSALDAFNGQSAAGDWTLQIVDTFGGDTGTVNTWSLEVDTRRR